jgi:sugar phosphate isomerase/epimerase
MLPSLAALARVAADDGVRVAVECLPRTCLGNAAAELRAIVDALDPAAAGVCLDVNHLNLREPDLGALHAGPFLYEVRAPDPDPAAALRAVEDNYRHVLATHASA